MTTQTWADVQGLEIETRHLDARTEEIVRDWFAGRITTFKLDGQRSVSFAHPDDPATAIKIKGAGANGQPVAWGRFRRTGPNHPVFDFDGRMMVDESFGHDNAQHGGASFQQAATEWAATAAFEAAGETVVPCLGYGRLRHGHHESWFSVVSHGADWHNAIPPEGLDLEVWARLMRGHGANMVRIARDHRLLGYFWYLATPEGRFPIKDLHPFRKADPLAMSAIGWVLTVYYGIHIFCNQIEFGALRQWKLGLPRETLLLPLTEICPDVTLVDHARLRAEIVAPCIVARPVPFNSREIWRRLNDINVTARLIEFCPAEFARP
jgi:hypothetical protein